MDHEKPLLQLGQTSAIVAIVAGYWSTNIGNSFFQLGAQYLLRQIFPDESIFLVGDQPGYGTVRQENPRDAFILLEQMPIDYIVILGPFLRPTFDKIWIDTLRRLYEKGTRVIALGAGMMDYRQSAIQDYRNWLSEFPPLVLTSRDTDTFNAVGDIAEHSFDGIDLGFFLPESMDVARLLIGPFVAFNFDKWPEPKVRLSFSGTNVGRQISFSYQGQIWTFSFPRLRTHLAKMNRLFSFIDTFLPQRRQVSIGDYRIVRTDHRFNPLFLRRIYRSPNTFVSDIPQGYAAIYSNAEITFSNRVHACVAALSYGKRAMLFSDSPRARLLERLSVNDIKSSPSKIDQAYLTDEKSNLVEFLRSTIG